MATPKKSSDFTASDEEASFEDLGYILFDANDLNVCEHENEDENEVSYEVVGLVINDENRDVNDDRNSPKSKTLGSCIPKLKEDLKPPVKRSVKTNCRKKLLLPSMHERMSKIIKPSRPLQEARSALHVSAIPKSLPCREEEFNNIFTFLKTRLTENSGG